jgi:hypothetical protein
VRFVPLSLQKFFTGLWTQRSPFNSPDNRYNTRFLGGRPELLTDGLNVEITNYGTIIRRPGTVQYSTAVLSSKGLAFYSFHDLTGAIRVMADTVLDVSVLTSTSDTVIFTKTAGSGQTDFIGVGNTLFFGDGIDLQAYQPNNNPAATRNWGIAIGSMNDAVGPTIAGTGTNVTRTGFATNWTNPNNVTATDTVNFAVGTANTNYLFASNFGFSIPFTSVINGIQVSFSGFRGSTNAGLPIDVQLVKNGSPVGTIKNTRLNPTQSTYTLGGTSDLWGTTWSPNDISQSTWGVYFFIPGSALLSANINNVQVTIFGTGGPTVVLQTGNGTLDTFNGGWEYVIAYGNSVSGHISNPTSASASTGNFGGQGFVNTSGTAVTLVSGANFIQGSTWNGRTIVINGTNFTVSAVTGPTTLTLTTSAGTLTDVTYLVGYAGVQVDLVASTDPQVNQIHVYRTKDGGSVFYELPTSPYPNTTQNIIDTSTDAGLQQLIFWPFVPTLSNTPPPAGLVHYVYHLGRIWGVVGNFVYYSAGPDVLLGSGNESFPPANSFLFPSTVVRLVPISSGLLVFTTDDTYIILGTNTATFYAMPFQLGLGILGYNALDVQGSNIFLYTSDRQFIQMTSAGINQIGYAIGDTLQAQFDPTTDIHVASLIQGTFDQAVFIGDAVGSWYRCNWNQPPEGGPAFSPKALITNGFTHFQQVETSPGFHQLLMFQNLGAQSIVLYRDPNTFTDNGTSYGAFLTVGSIVLAQPGQLAEVVSITTELQQRGTQPAVSVLLEEIAGNFEVLPNGVPDPPGLVPSNSVLAQRFYLTQSQNTVDCRHLQIKLQFIPEPFKNELLTLSIWGALKYTGG